MIDNVLLPAGTAVTGATMTATGETLPYGGDPHHWDISLNRRRHLRLAGTSRRWKLGASRHHCPLNGSFNVFTMGASAVRDI